MCIRDRLRGAIPVSQGFQLQLLQSYIVCVIGNMLPVPVIYLFARKVLEWGKDKKYIGKFFTFCIEKGHKGGEKLKEKAGRGLFVALLLFVGIPLPGTGAWTGTLAASFLDMGFKKSVIAVLLGVLLAGVIMGIADVYKSQVYKRTCTMLLIINIYDNILVYFDLMGGKNFG